jgi:hypothetical protein
VSPQPSKYGDDHNITADLELRTAAAALPHICTEQKKTTMFKSWFFLSLADLTSLFTSA